MEFLAKRKSCAQGNDFSILDFSLHFSGVWRYLQRHVGGTSHTSAKKRGVADQQARGDMLI
jgi:hypothetical protein